MSQSSATRPTALPTDRGEALGDQEARLRLPGARIGVVGGLVGILCCVGPAALALLGLIGGATAYTLATELYATWGWGFRAAGLLVAGALVWAALRRRNACSIAGVKRSWRSLAVIALAGVATYAVLYAVTTWLGTLAV